MRHVVGLSDHIEQRGFLSLDDFEHLLSKRSLILRIVVVSVKILREFRLSPHHEGGENDVPVVHEHLRVVFQKVSQHQIRMQLDLLIRVCIAQDRGESLIRRDELGRVLYHGAIREYPFFVSELTIVNNDLFVSSLQLDLEHFSRKRCAQKEKLVEVNEQGDDLVVWDFHLQLTGQLWISVLMFGIGAIVTLVAEVHGQLESSYHGGQLGDESFGSMVRIDFGHHVVELFLETLIDRVVVLLNVLRILLDENVGDAVHGTPESLVKERIGVLQDG